jgi:hypothetical protein
VRGLAAAAFFQALSQHVHEIDHLRALARLRGFPGGRQLVRLMLLDLLLDALHEVAAIRVLELIGMPVA